MRRTLTIYPFRTEGEAKLRKEDLDKWAQGSEAMMDEPTEFARGVVYEDNRFGSTLWMTTLLVFDESRIPKERKARERWLRKELDRLTLQSKQPGSDAKRVVGTPSTKGKAKVAGGVASKARPTPSRSQRSVPKSGRTAKAGRTPSGKSTRSPKRTGRRK